MTASNAGRDKVIWFYTVDAGHARLLRCERVEPGRLHVEQCEVLEFVAEEYERGRPSPRSTQGGNSYASGGHEDEQQLHRFAKQVAGWLERTLGGLDGEPVTLFSAPRFLGELRKRWSDAVSRRLEEQSSDLGSLSPGQLEAHPAVEKLYDAAVCG